MHEKVDTREIAVNRPINLDLPQKEYTYMENFVHFWVNIPICCGIGHELSYKVAKGNYVCEDLSIAYRAERRNPGEVFEQGFSAYSFYRSLNKFVPSIDDLINGEISGKEFFFNILPWITIFLPITILYFAIRILFNIIFYPLSFFGQSLYEAPFISNWSALALSKEERNVWCFLSSTSVFWRYVVVLDGYIDFSEFSKNIIADKKDQDPRDSEDSSVYDAGEIFPKSLNNQTNSPECIVGAYKIVNGKKTEFCYNPNFFGLSKLSKNLDHSQNIADPLLYSLGN